MISVSRFNQPNIKALETCYQITWDDYNKDQQEVYAILFEARQHDDSPEHALELCQQAYGKAQAINFQIGIAWYQREIGSMLEELGNLEQAETHLHQALELFQVHNIQTGLASSHNVLGHIEATRGNYVASNLYYTLYITLSEQLGRVESHGIGLGNLANNYVQLGDYWQALELQFFAHRILTQGDQAYLDAATWVEVGIGHSYQLIGKPHKAISVLQAALKIQFEIGAFSDLAHTKCHLASALEVVGELEAAQVQLHEALQLAESMKADLTRAKIIWQLAQLELKIGDLAQALALSNQALTISQAKNAARFIAKSQANLASVLMQQPTNNKLAITELLEQSLAWACQTKSADLQQQILELRLQFYQRLAAWQNALEASLELRKLEADKLQKTFEQVEQAISLRQNLLNQNKSLTQQTKQLEYLSERDPLTGAYNRRGFERIIKHFIAEQKSFCLCLIDVDHLKKVNDQFGHLIGDQVIVRLAQVLTAATSPAHVARLGGDEFALWLEMPVQQALSTAEALRLQFAEIQWQESTLQPTVSLGMAQRQPNDSRESLLRQADTHLYRAKNSGRNKLILE